MTLWDFFVGASLVIVVTAASIYITEWFRSKPKKGERDPYVAPSQKDYPNGPSTNFAALIDAINYQGRANRAEEKSEDRGKIFRESIVIALLILNLYILYRQVGEMIRAYAPISEQAQASKEYAAATSLAQRAWVGPGDVSLDKVPAKAADDVKVTIPYQNSGREPARSFVLLDPPDVFTATDKEDGDGTVTRRLGQDIVNCMGAQPPPAAQVVYPSIGFSSYNVAFPIKKEIVDQDVVDGTKTILIEGCFVYFTIGIIHRSTWCYFYNAKKSQSGHLNVCRLGNYAD